MIIEQELENKLIRHIKNVHPFFSADTPQLLDKNFVLVGYNQSLRYLFAKSLLGRDFCITTEISEKSLLLPEYVFRLDIISEKDQYRIMNESSINHVFITSCLTSCIEPIKYNSVSVNTDSFSDSSLVDLVKIFVGGGISDEEANNILIETNGDFLSYEPVNVEKVKELNDAVKISMELLAAGQYPENILKKLAVVISADSYLNLLEKIIREEIKSGSELEQAKELQSLVLHLSESGQYIKDWKTLKLSLTYYVLNYSLLRETVVTSTIFGTTLGKFEHKRQARGFYATAIKSKNKIESKNSKKIPMAVEKLAKLLEGKIMGVIVNAQRN